ncbi:MAG: NADP-specific glutamate dehydrogenase [Alteromonadaceae bacterium]|nr:NADP-specific glutamate dehydrogenase [Alteromonadaceae bacterium]
MSQLSNRDSVLKWLTELYGDQKEYLQAVEEIVDHVMPVSNASEAYKRYDVVRRLCVPERIIHFNVQWMNDDGGVEIHRGWRVQHNGLIGPYKGGLRFHPTVNESVLKFLAFEQSFKNALTGLPMGGAKGGSDFNPKGRSDNEIMRFCQAFMAELQRHIGPQTDVPAGDINVSSREIGFMYGQYRRIHNQFGGTLTGKDISFGGSHVRTEATGFGLIYMLQEVLAAHDDTLEGKRTGISGAGNVALHAALKACESGAVVTSLSNSRGCLIKEDGLSKQDIQFAIEQKHNYDNILLAIREESGGEWHEGKKPWHQTADICLPCATQNELVEDDADMLCGNGVKYVLEGANMPCTANAQKVFAEHRIPFVPGKASNAGGVALSGLEMMQNASFRRSSYDTLDNELKKIMKHIHEQCVEEGREDGFTDYAKGANIAAFRRLADAMVAQGL